MYKVFINNKPLILTSQKNSLDFIEKDILTFNFNSEKDIQTAVHSLTNEINVNGAVIFYDDEEMLWKKFCNQFKILEAAGGLVFNEQRELLMIYRFEKWDLPKGKIEKGETPVQAALREVCEETGVCTTEIVRELNAVYHTYQHHENAILKKTYWFEMRCILFSGFTLQDEEGIKEARWIKKQDLSEVLKNTYRSLIEILNNTF